MNYVDDLENHDYTVVMELNANGDGIELRCLENPNNQKEETK